MKENWEELGIALKSDKYILQLMKETKQKFDRMKKNGNLIEASSLRKTTFNLAAVDWRDIVNQDQRLRADLRKEKFFTKCCDPLDLSKLKKLLDLAYIYPRGVRRGAALFFF